MKNIAAIITLLLSLLSVKAQEDNSTIKNGSLVKVKNWPQVAFLLPENFWEDSKKNKIIDQIGAVEFEKVKEFSKHQHIPEKLQSFQASTQSMTDSTEYQQKNNKLKVYKIASYDHWWDGKSWGTYAILCLPFKENQNWDPNVKWDTVYFIIPEKYIHATQ